MFHSEVMIDNSCGGAYLFSSKRHIHQFGIFVVLVFNMVMAEASGAVIIPLYPGYTSIFAQLFP